jgi:hypothetical protein
MMKSSIAAIGLALFLSAPVLAANEGQAVGVAPDANARQGSTERVLVVGADVSVGEQIVTGPSGRVQLLFKDDTRIVVGPGSSLKIETYLLKGNTAEKFAMNALAGTFRFISGNSPKSAYAINTPTASIAVRGTAFDLAVTRNFTQAMLYDGALSMCRGTDCVDLVNRCDIGALGSGPNGVFPWGSTERSSMVGNFPFAHLQSILLPRFRISGSQACLAPPPTQSPDGLSTTTGGSGTPTTPPTTPVNPSPPTTPGTGIITTP